MARVPLPERLQQHPFAVAEALALGVSPERLRGPDLARPFWGVRSTTLPVRTRAKVQAFLPRLPNDAFFCSLTAAELFDSPLPLDLRDGSLHVAVPAPRRALRASGITGRSIRVSQQQLTLRYGVRCSGPELMMTELASILQLADLVAVGDHLIHWRHPFTTIDRLSHAAENFPFRRGRPVLQRAVGLLDDRAESPKESHLRVLMVDGGLDSFESNVSIRVTSGHSYRGDLVHRGAKVVLEYQGDHHREPEEFRRDMTRRSRLEADGWHIMLIGPDDLKNPRELCARVRALVALARARMGTAPR